MRALHLRNSDRVSGPERLILQQFQRASPDVDAALAVFVTGGKTNPFLEVAKDAGMRAVAIGQRSSYDRKVKRALLAACKDLDPHVLVTHDYKANLIGRPIARMLGIACVAVVHGYTAESLRVRAFEHLDRRALKRFDAVVAVSDVMETRLLKAGVPRERLHRIENTIDADSITMAALAARDEARRTWAPSEERLIVTLGRLSPEKGLRDLLQALADVSFPRWRWLVVGDGPQEAQLREDAKRAGIADRVRFAGWVVDSSAALGAADVFAMPSHTEGLPLALLEAMAVGLPIVATRVGGMPKALADGACARLVDPQDVAGMAAALDELLGDPDTAQALGAAAAKRVRSHYGADTQVQALEALYRSVAKRDQA